MPFILTADDFGRSMEVNEAVARWASAGALTQASLMVNEKCVEHAMSVARRFPDLRIGLHLTLCDGHASDGTRLTAGPASMGLKIAFWPGARSWVRDEIAAQFTRFRALGLPPSYWDGHAHLHLHPVVMRMTVPVAVQHGFRFTRLVREPGAPSFLSWIFNRLSRNAVPRLRAAGIGYADRIIGLRRTGRMTEQDFREAFRLGAPGGTTEIYFHPGAESQLPEPEWVARALKAID